MKKRFKNITFTLLFASMAFFAQAQKFGFINAQEIIGSLPEVKEANSEIETLKAQLQKKGEAMINAFQAKYQDLEQKQASGQISRVQLETEAAKLKEEENKIREYEQTSQLKISQKGETLFKPIQEKVNLAIKDVAAENGYTYIFDTSLGILLYADPGTDVTPLVKAKLGVN